MNKSAPRPHNSLTQVKNDVDVWCCVGFYVFSPSLFSIMWMLRVLGIKVNKTIEIESGDCCS
jgi:hypothetical protein